MDVYIGLIFPWAIQNYAPDYTAFCNGSVLNVSQNQALYALLGTRFGGTAPNTFALPDLRGRVIMGSTAMGGSSPLPVTQSYPFASRGGLETITLGIANIPSHNHPAASTLTGAQATIGNLNLQASGNLPVNTGAGSTDTPGGTSGYPSQIPDLSGAGAANTFYGAPTAGASMPVNVTVSSVTTPTVSINSATINTATGNIGGGMAFTNLQPYLVLNYIITLQGLFPVQS